MDQNGSNLIKLDFWWNNNWNISSDFQLYFFWSDWIRSVQNGSNLIKLVFWWNNHWKISSPIFNFIYLLIAMIRFNQICSKQIIMDQTWSNWISDEIITQMNCQMFILSILWSDLIIFVQKGSKWIKLDPIGFLMKCMIRFSSLFIFDRIVSDLSKTDQNGSNLIKFVFWLFWSDLIFKCWCNKYFWMIL